jgi:hypothetical protein
MLVDDLIALWEYRTEMPKHVAAEIVAAKKMSKNIDNLSSGLLFFGFTFRNGLLRIFI